MIRKKKFLCIFTVIVLMISVFIPPAAATAVQAAATTSPVFIDGVEMHFEAYCINGSNYFKLRDIAYALSGTPKRFQATFDDIQNQVVLTSQTDYTAVGGEMAVSGRAESVNAESTTADVYLDGVKLSLTAYIIHGSNYTKLRDIAAAVNFGVRYVQETSAIEIDTSTGYTADQAGMTFPCDLNVTFIGDSVGAGITPYLKTFFPNMYIDAKASRQFYAAKGIIEALQQSNKLGSTVVIELGTNGAVKESDVRRVIELIGNDRKIVIVNCSVPRAWGLADNQTFAKVAAEFPNTIIADWYAVSANNSGYFYEDRVHPNKAGAAAMAQVIADAIAKIQPYKPYIPVQ